MRNEGGRSKYRRRSWTAEQKAELVERWCESGLTRAEFCRREGVSYGRFPAWIAQWTEEEESGPEFVEVLDAGPRPASNPAEGVIELVAPNGWRIRLGGAFEHAALEEVMKLVGRC